VLPMNGTAGPGEALITGCQEAMDGCVCDSKSSCGSSVVLEWSSICIDAGDASCHASE